MNNIPLHVYNPPADAFITDGCLDYFYILATVNDAAMNMHVQICQDPSFENAL
jgi:hypothetical protein